MFRGIVNLVAAILGFLPTLLLSIFMALLVFANVLLTIFRPFLFPQPMFSLLLNSLRSCIPVNSSYNIHYSNQEAVNRIQGNQTKGLGNWSSRRRLLACRYWFICLSLFHQRVLRLGKGSGSV